MAQIQASNDTSMLKIKSFLGLNENPDGSTVLKVGELSEMRNFRITQDGHLQIRPGSQKLFELETISSYDEDTRYLQGVWNGTINGVKHTIAAFNGKIYDINLENKTKTQKGTCTNDETTFFGFGNKVYMLNGHEYKSWDGDSNTTFADVVGYIPTIMTSTEPTGEGSSYEARNHLTNKVKVEFDANGSATQYYVGEKSITSVDSVEVNGTAMTTGYTVDLTNGKVTFSTAPTQGENNVIIGYTKGTAERSIVENMHYSEFFNGTSDTRVFLYGDGSNKTIYSGIDSDGNPTADYFAENDEIKIGEENTAITSLVRHYSRMLAFKPDSAYQIYGQLKTLANNIVTMAYYVTPVNRQFGNKAMGQVKLLENNPVSLDSGAAFQWKAYATNSSFASNEQNASRISDKVVTTLKNFDFEKTKMYNLKHNREYWFIYKNKALILNYVNSSWYVYEGLPFQMIIEIENNIYGFANDGKIYEFSRSYRNDEEAIHYTFDSTDWEASAYGGQNGTFTFDYIDGKWYDNVVEEVDMEDIGLDLDDNPTNNSVINVTRLREDEVTASTEVSGLSVTIDDEKFLEAYQYWFQSEFPSGTFTPTFNGTMWTVSISGQGTKILGTTQQMAENLFITVTGTPASGDTITLVHDVDMTYTIKEYSAIDAYAATGSMDFDKDWLLKYSPMIFVATQPESNSRVFVTVESDKRSDYPEHMIANNLISFLHMDFNHFSFGTNRKPRVKRVKLKVKKATYYKMIFKSNSTSATATVLETDVKLRYAGEVK